MEKYDFIIIGAGPAGCMAAKILGEKHRILLLEKMIIPRQKSCSGVLIKKSVDIVERIFGIIPDEVITTPKTTNGITIITTNKTHSYRDNGINVDRQKFDAWLTERQNKNNVTLVQGTRIISYDRVQTIIQYTAAGTIKSAQAQAVIGADGVNGISRHLVNEIPDKKIITFQRIVKGHIDGDESSFYAFTSPQFSSYDAWFNQKNGNCIYGVSGFSKIELIQFMETFEKQLQMTFGLTIQQHVREEYWCLPFISKDHQINFAKKNIFFCGEAAGFLSPFGEGMYLAFKSAEILCSIMENPENRSFESRKTAYQTELKDTLEYMKRQWSLIKRISPEFASQMKKTDDAICKTISAVPLLTDPRSPAAAHPLPQ
jgi:flavin-dependent dehydrogenase